MVEIPLDLILYYILLLVSVCVNFAYEHPVETAILLFLFFDTIGIFKALRYLRKIYKRLYGETRVSRLQRLKMFLGKIKNKLAGFIKRKKSTQQVASTQAPINVNVNVDLGNLQIYPKDLIQLKENSTK